MKTLNKIILVILLASSSFFGALNFIDNKNIQTTPKNINTNESDLSDLRFIKAFTNYIYLHVKGLEDELNYLKNAILQNSKLDKTFTEELKTKDSYFFDSYFLSFILLNSEYGLGVHSGEYSAELFNFWINTPEQSRNLFWVLVDFFYINVVPKIINKNDKEIELILEDTLNVPGLTVNLKDIKKGDNFIDFFVNENISPAWPKIQMSISSASHVWHTEGTDYNFSRKNEKAFEFDNKWVPDEEIEKITNKLNLIFWTRGKPIRSDDFINNFTFNTFEELNTNLKEATKFYIDGADYYGVNLKDAIYSYINTNNDLWNNANSSTYINLDYAFQKISNKFLISFNYLFYVYKSIFKNKNDDSYLHLIKSIIFHSKKTEKIPNGKVIGLNSDSTYGLEIQINFNLLSVPNNNSLISFDNFQLATTTVHEIGHVVDLLVTDFDWTNGNNKLINFNENTYKLLVEWEPNITEAFGVDVKKNKLDEVQNKRKNEINKYSNLDTPTLIMNIANPDELYYKIREEMQSYIMKFKDDMWAEGKDLSKVVKNSYIKYGDKYLDEAITEIMKSYNDGESKVYNLKLTPYYEFEDSIDLNFNVINTKKELKNLSEIKIDDQVIDLNDDKEQSIELVTELINKQLISNDLTNMNWTIIENGKFTNIEDIDFENGNSLKVLVTDNDQKYSGYIMFDINYSLKINLSNLITDKHLGDVNTKNSNELLKIIESKYPIIKGEIDIDYNYPIGKNEIAIKAKSESKYYGIIVFTFNYIDNEIGPNPLPGDNEGNSLEVIVIAVIISAIVIIIITGIVIIIRKRKQ
ncbi:hypothetical protein STIUS_v1c02890 [Spiroplasma sp. TIUS-1]|uniref:hypothetical protein n=1 Tax=Spiroplasma sp. TIUS-1 TaxID=216963 RepID=UPI0013981123|nr:hypothetical protein [Spiroplasma sp. TIUS-1]QHX35843.1 hypothetical protein STIUS_v1c02890 [Spiroplasma sp. TIUS-1]